VSVLDSASEGATVHVDTGWSGPKSTSSSHVAIVGAGFSGTLQAINLVRHSDLKVTLIEQRESFARGLAYSTRHACHLLNVRAGNMSALPEWLTRQGQGVGLTFATRQEYGRYLSGLLHEAVVGSEGRLHLRPARVSSLRWDRDQANLEVDRGPPIAADRVVLALGNLPPHVPALLAATVLPPSLYVPDPWTADFTRDLSASDTVLLLGTSLTMVDVAIALHESGFRGRMVAVSRRGLVPRAHGEAVAGATSRFAAAPTDRGAALVRRIRELAREVGWRAAIDSLRPHSQSMWMSASKAEQARFLRHLRPWWDVHRHRLAPQVAERVDRFRAQGVLEVVAAKLAGIQVRDGVAEVEIRLRHSDTTRRIATRRIINCTAPEGDLLQSPEPLLRQLVQDGAIRPGKHGIAIDVNARSEVVGADGRANPRLLALGPLTRGTFWEIVAVPDIRVQTWSVARQLSHA
jgi:uncharacterized NAD(P)/FAD-binding protein YdhS